MDSGQKGILNLCSAVKLKQDSISYHKIRTHYLQQQLLSQTPLPVNPPFHIYWELEKIHYKEFEAKEG